MHSEKFSYYKSDHRDNGGNVRELYPKYTLGLFEDGASGGVVVKALRYKPAGRGFDSRWCHWNFSVT